VKAAVVGAGFAGLAAALALLERGDSVVVLERRGVLGGRTTSHTDAVTGDAVDSGSHVLFASWRETLGLLERVAPDLLDRDLARDVPWDGDEPVLLRAGWGRIVDRLADALRARGGTIRTRALVERIEVEGDRAARLSLVQRAFAKEDRQRGQRATRESLDFDAFVCAAPPQALAEILPLPWRERAPFGAAARIAMLPAVSVDVWIAGAARLPALRRLDGEPFDSFVNKGRAHGRSGEVQHISLIAGPRPMPEPRTNAEWTSAAREALMRACALENAQLQRALVLREPLAGFPDDETTRALRPAGVTPVSRLLLAGDYVNTGLPGGIESAVRSGRLAAEAAHAPPKR